MEEWRMYYENKTDQFNYGVVRAKKCDLSSYLILYKKKDNSENNTHITTDKSKNQMKE